MWRYFHCHVTWMSFQVRIRHLWCVIWPQIKSWFELLRAFWPLTAAIHMYVRLTPVSRERKSMFSLFGKAPKRGKQNYLFLCITQRLSRRPPPLSRGWIAVSWRWIWSIRSINRDYCNPRGQKEGRGPLRVHASHTGSRQICAGMANMYVKSGKSLRF